MAVRSKAAVAVGLPEDVEIGTDEIVARAAIRLRQCKGVTLTEAPDHRNPRRDRALLRAIALSHLWERQLAAGEVKSIFALAKGGGFCKQHAARLLPLDGWIPAWRHQSWPGNSPK
jgi:hypothetical protein